MSQPDKTTIIFYHDGGEAIAERHYYGWCPPIPEAGDSIFLGDMKHYRVRHRDFYFLEYADGPGRMGFQVDIWLNY